MLNMYIASDYDTMLNMYIASDYDTMLNMYIASDYDTMLNMYIASDYDTMLNMYIAPDYDTMKEHNSDEAADTLLSAAAPACRYSYSKRVLSLTTSMDCLLARYFEYCGRDDYYDENN
eukprot:90285_1